MRSRFLLTVILISSLLTCGCMQIKPPVTEAAPPAPAGTPVPTAKPAPGPKVVNLTAWEGEHEVILQYNGGKDADSLLMLIVQIDNRDGKIVRTSIYSPVIGKQYLFPYKGVVNPNTINIVGLFDDGSQQTLLIQYF